MQFSIFISRLLIVILAIAFVQPGTAIAQPSAQEQDLLINLADKADLDLLALVQWLANTKKMRITANSAKFPSTTNNKVIFFGEVKVSADAMLDVVQSVLRTNGFALVRSEVEDLYQIVQLADVRPFSQVIPDGADPADFPKGEYITGIFPLGNTTPTEAQAFIKQMIYGNNANTGTANITTLPNRNTLVITETSTRLAKIRALLEKIDVPGQIALREFYTVKNLQAEELKQQLVEILGSTTATTSGQPAGSNSQPKSAVKIDTVNRKNQLILSGSRAQIDDAKKIIEQLDVPTELELQTYQFQNISAKKIDELIRQSFKGMDEKQVQSVYQSDVNEQGNELIVTTRNEFHLRIDEFKKQLDVPSATGSGKSPVEFYRLKNVKAIDILETLQSIEGRVNRNSSQRTGRTNRLDGINPNPGFLQDNENLRNQNALTRNSNGQNSPFVDPFGLGSQSRGGFDSGAGIQGFGNSVVGDLARLAGEFNVADRVIPGEAKLTVDENSNTLIVVAAPAIQKLYAELIAKLDVRRPQVLVEVQVVTVSKTDDASLGIEISTGDRTGDRRIFSLTSFELSDVDAVTGALSIIPGVGFNGALVDPDTADVVLRALARHANARVVTAPKILVNDNATGLLSSVLEQPFASLNSGNTATTSTLGGFATAGTTISVTPQISEDDYLNLEFDILVNNFVGAASSDLLPPARTTDQVTSQVSIPDGHTIIVGGLTRDNASDTLAGLPFIERIPILNRLTSSQTEEEGQQRLFVFIKPIILRDDKFRDLRFLSESERRDAGIPGDLPTSSPVLIR